MPFGPSWLTPLPEPRRSAKGAHWSTDMGEVVKPSLSGIEASASVPKAEPTMPCTLRFPLGRTSSSGTSAPRCSALGIECRVGRGCLAGRRAAGRLRKDQWAPYVLDEEFSTTQTIGADKYSSLLESMRASNEVLSSPSNKDTVHLAAEAGFGEPCSQLFPA